MAGGVLRPRRIDAMRITDFFNSAFALRIGLGIGQILPLPVGYGLAGVIVNTLLRRRNSSLCRSIRSNLRVVYGPDASDELIERTLRRVLHHAGHVYYDLYYALGKGVDAILAGATTTPQTEDLLQELASSQRGVVVTGVHMSNFDLAALAFGSRGTRPLVMAWAAPTSGYRLQNEIRRAGGFEVTPIDSQALRKAIRHLRGGGMMITGIDRPDPWGGGELIPFFGQPARMPMGHVRLALQTDVPIIVAACEYRPVEGRYVVHSAGPFEMERVGSREEDVMHNTLRILAVVESYIRAHPDQWLMFYPVWEEDVVENQEAGRYRGA